GTPAKGERSAAVPQSKISNAEERRCNATRGSLLLVENAGQLPHASIDRLTEPGAVAVVDSRRCDSSSIATARASGSDDGNSCIPDGGGEEHGHDIWDLIRRETGRRSVAWPVFSTHFL
ncbi:unnamed protein product, partial [Sphacelaria rigidula]